MLLLFWQLNIDKWQEAAFSSKLALLHVVIFWMKYFSLEITYFCGNFEDPV